MKRGHRTFVLGHLGVLVVAGAAVWWAGTRLSRDADALAGSTGLGRVFVGAVLLGVATSLPEIATTITAGVLSNPQLATGNLMGGVALQVVVLAIADLVESDERLMFQVSRPTVLIQHVMVLIMLALTIAGMAAGEPFSLAGFGLWPMLLAAVFAFSLWIIKRHEGNGAWSVTGRQPTLGRGAEDSTAEDDQAVERPPLWRLAGLCSVILVAGWLVARSGDVLSREGPLSGTFVGAALVAVTTSLPEMSTVLGALRAGAYDMAVSNIMGTNGLEIALLLVADAAYRDGPIVAQATSSDMFLASLAALLTGVYLGGLLLRQERTVLRIGYDSAIVIVAYLGGIVVLAALS